MGRTPFGRRALFLSIAAVLAGTAAVDRRIRVPEPPSDIQVPIEAPAFQVAPATSNAAPEIAKAYGVDHANEIEAMAFSLNVQYGETTTRREWYWDVADGRVEYHGEGPTGLPIQLVYYRDHLDKGDPVLNRLIDEQFVDDQYWLLFPFHLAWEKDLQVVDQPSRPMYIEPHEAECVSIRYPEGSPSQGDVYELFTGPDHLIREWAYRPRNSVDPAFVTTWERNAKAGPVLFSLMHRSSDGEYRLWFDRVSVKIVGQGWVDAQPLEDIVSRSDGPPALSKNPL